MSPAEILAAQEARARLTHASIDIFSGVYDSPIVEKNNLDTAIIATNRNQAFAAEIDAGTGKRAVSLG